jgi:GT2 family glycosyltransferase
MKPVDQPAAQVRQPPDPREYAQAGGVQGVSSDRLAVVIVHYRTPRSLAECLEAVQAQSQLPEVVVVVDNSAIEDDLDIRPVFDARWRWIAAKRNMGFGAACNLGARLSRSEYVLFLNADVILDGDACERLRRATDADSSVGVVGPRIISADGSIELSARSFPTAATGLAGRSSVLTSWLRRFGRAPRGVAGALGGSGRVDWVSGACMLVRRGAFEEVGGFDEAYWMYWEDADLCRRLASRGWTTMLCVDASARHSTGSSGTSPRTIEAFHRSAGLYYERHIAQSRQAARLARALLVARMRLMIRRHERRKRRPQR